MVERTGDSPALREILRERTADEHERLDRGLSSLAFGTRAQYARFLSIQYAARHGIERWLETRGRNDRLPAMTPLIAADLDALGCALPETLAFDAPKFGDAIGASWVLAGSSLGNRAILSRRNKLGLHGPNDFISDRTMPQRFKELLVRLAQPVAETQSRASVLSAKAVFSHFLRAAEIEPERCAA